MTKENDHLTNMLKENKISEDDYKLLSTAINKKTSRMNSLLYVMANPFQKIAGLKALIIGLIIIFSMSYLGTIAKCYSVGTLGSLNASAFHNPNVQPTFFLLLYQNLVAWLTMSILFIAFSKFFQQKRLRLIDFFGTVAFARFPFLILTLFLALARISNPSFLNLDLTKGLQLHPSVATSLFSAFVGLCFIWEIIAYFYALSESSGLTGKKLWLSFIGAIILGEAIGSPLTMIFF